MFGGGAKMALSVRSTKVEQVWRNAGARRPCAKRESRPGGGGLEDERNTGPRQQEQQLENSRGSWKAEFVGTMDGQWGKRERAIQDVIDLG